ncbi:MAG: hypothetical protein CBC34_011870 [Hyphomicrobiaceae bacterium TMED74]|nr:hypothetical protein [Filomicrobium sp.]RPG40635.1 MAG: hypothetical protein CBC34_011870 [Hyphomicrobiaceae bacterium TMED74]
MRTKTFSNSDAHSDADFEDWNDGSWQEPAAPKRDWKKVFLVLGLGGLSWVATYVGMLELIQSNMGDLGLTHKIIIGFSVAMLMTMIIWLLDQMFAPLPLTTKLAYVFGYVFLTLISVGFGFGFYWKVLESRSEASRSAESAVSQVKTSLFAASSRLDQLQTTLEQLTALSSAKAVEERERGTTCPNSRPGDGPRRRLRDADAARFSFASEFVRSRAAKAKTDMNALDIDLEKIANVDPSTFDPKTGTRNKFLKGLARKLELTATGFNAFRTDPQLKQIRTELAERSAKTVFPNTRGGTFSCPDPQLQSALRGVVRAIDQLPELSKPEIATVEGTQAVVEAFRRLTATFYGVLTFKLPPSADELRALRQKAIQSVESNRNSRSAAVNPNHGGLAKRDYIPLAIAIFVDLCLLLVSIGRPINRLNGLLPKMREAERGPVYQILTRFDDIHKDQQVRQRFEVFRHVVFDYNGDYYVAVPLDAPRNQNPAEVNSLQQEAHLLANLFASFEKEKIFARVYNPLLTRKVIQKKLWRQGSKFANSQAFRTYRFRDGAWSEIILGAIMGASRRSEMRKRKRAAERGPELDIQIAPSVQPHPSDGPNPLDLPIPEFNERDKVTTASARAARAERSTAPVDQRLSERFGPYAQSLREDITQEDLDHRETDHPAANGWPWKRPPAPPSEAEVALQEPANSNTHTNWRENLAPANVIPMPSVRGHQAEQGQSSAPGNLNASNAAAANAPLPSMMPSASASAMTQLKSEPVAFEEDASATLVQESDTATQSRAVNETKGINVRITERTADFALPATEAHIPQRLAQNLGGLGCEQLMLDFSAEEPTRLSSEDVPVQQPAQEILTLEASSDAIVLTDATGEDLEDLSGADEQFIYGTEGDDPMLRVAQKFAADRTQRD